MPKFVWQQNARGVWRPSIFYGELPRDMTVRHNAGLYRVHEISDFHAEQAQTVRDRGANPLDYLAHAYPPPAPEPREILIRIEEEQANAV